eukprot:gnl/MRDRNA2_/MRDRNA2_63270_c0_seq1.p1 gnl/MRDRNA2_/MRDRNA2_63270_c0~~gnl/MRDRNA2_/MRDRNA2_63270_c0_seq1.p1  ORF type:complete len:702 (-),score=113.89 gnl/MRDRNA2_/MRDRNA2_63270_c0_seq1:281-2386(-)
MCPSPVQGDEQREPVAASPTVKGKAKGKGKGPPLPPVPPPPTVQGDERSDPAAASPTVKGKGKGKGKGPGAPPPPAGKMDSATPVAEKTLFGRKLHFTKPGHENPTAETIFHNLEDATGDLRIDVNLLTALFNNGTRRNSIPSTPRGSMPNTPRGMAVLDSKRAQKMAIVFGQLKSSTEDICKQLHEVDFSEPLLSIDQIDLVLGALPTSEEAKSITAVADKVCLRDVERKVLPFCELPHCDLRLRLLRVSMSHLSCYESITSQLNEIQLACMQLQESTCLRKLFAAVLEAGNQVNGVAHTPQAVQSFSIETLSRIPTFKIGETSMVHFLCITLHKADPCFLQTLLGELGSLNNAARTKVDVLLEEIDAFRKEGVSVERDATSAFDGAGGCWYSVKRLIFKLREEIKELQQNMSRTNDVQSTAQAYFGASGKLPPSDTFFGYFTEFLSTFATVWHEICRNPEKWHRSLAETSENRCSSASPEKSIQNLKANEVGAGSTSEATKPRASSKVKSLESVKSRCSYTSHDLSEDTRMQRSEVTEPFTTRIEGSSKIAKLELAALVKETDARADWQRDWQPKLTETAESEVSTEASDSFNVSFSFDSDSDCESNSDPIPERSRQLAQTTETIMPLSSMRKNERGLEKLHSTESPLCSPDSAPKTRCPVRNILIPERPVSKKPFGGFRLVDLWGGNNCDQFCFTAIG